MFFLYSNLNKLLLRAFIISFSALLFSGCFNSNESDTVEPIVPVVPINPVDPEPIDPVDPEPIDPVDPEPIDPADPEPIGPVVPGEENNDQPIIENSIIFTKSQEEWPTIPTSHPRLLFTSEANLQRARTWYTTNQFTPSIKKHEELALHYLLSGEVTSARTAIDWLMAFDPSVYSEATQSDHARWSGEKAILIFDWCYDQMTIEEKKLIITRWNEFITSRNNRVWGGVDMPFNNYYWGFLRNSLEWGITTFHENDKAQSFIDNAIELRYRNTFIPFAAEGEGRGGVAIEGTQYGPYMINYPMIPLVSTANYGLNLFDETNFYKELIYYFIYSTTLGPTSTDGGAQDYYVQFPFSDDEFYRTSPERNLHQSTVIGTPMTILADLFSGTIFGKHAQQYLDKYNPPVSLAIQSLSIQQESENFNALPLDYYAPGMGYFYTKNSWENDAMLINLQLGVAPRKAHHHLDSGSFQLWRNGRWLTRETVSYSETIMGWNNTQTNSPVRSSIGHNTILFEGQGQANGYEDGKPEIIRLESQKDFSFAAVDLSLAYRAHNSSYFSSIDEGKLRDDNPHVSKVIREFVFIRDLEVMVIFDRMESVAFDRSDLIDQYINPKVNDAKNVRKTFLIHFESAPDIDDENNVVEAINGDQSLRLQTLIPENPIFRVVEEVGSGESGQYRLEIDTSGEAQSYFINILHGKNIGEENVIAQVYEHADGFFTVNLTHSSGKASIVFNKGMESQGGKIGFSEVGDPELVPFTNEVQDINVTESGPVWQ